MIQVLNLYGALEIITPELSRRLAASVVCDWCGDVEIALPRESATFAVRDGEVAVTTSASGAPRVEASQGEFVRLLSGSVVSGSCRVPRQRRCPRMTARCWAPCSLAARPARALG